MKFSISKSELQKGLARIQSIVEKRSTMPILAHVLIDAPSADKPILELAATDLEVGTRAFYSASIEVPGSITVSAKKLFEIVRELPDASISIQTTPNAYLEISCERAQFTLAGTSAEEYPTLPAFSSKTHSTISAILLLEMIEQTLYAASADETRYNLNGVYLEQLPDSGKTRMVATDGHRLAIIDRLLDIDPKMLENGVIIPRKGVTELKRLLDEDDTDELELSFEGNSGLATKGDITLLMRLIEGEFPNYRQVIPKETKLHFVLAVEPFSRALRRVALLSAERSRAIKLELSEQKLSLSSNNPDLGDAREDLDIDYSGEPLSVAFNARYLIDALAPIRAKEVRISFRDAISPAQINPTDDEDALAVVMPMRV